jgi:hypothetical protein
MNVLNTADKLYFGATEVDRAYVGTHVVWEPPATGDWGPDESLYPAAAAAEGQAPSILSLGSRIGILSDGRITHIRYWRASGMVPSRTVMIWSDAGALLFSKTSTGVPGWNSEPVSPPLAVSAGAVIRVAYGYAGSGADGYFGFIVSEAVHADTTNLDFISGCYHPGGSADFPDTIPGDASNYYADIIYQEALAPPLVVPSVWNAADASSGGFVLTNGGLTFQATIRGYRSIRGTNSHTTGKHYVEFLSGVNTGGTDDPAFGLSDAGASVGNYLGSSANQLSAFCAATTGNYSTPAGAITSFYNAGGVFPAAGDVWAYAVDLDAGKFWLARNNVWFGSGNPASGATPQFTYVAPILGQALFPAMGVRDEVSTPVWTMHATAASQKYAPPSGFTPWDGAGTAPTGPTTHLCTSFTPGTGRNDYTGEVGVRLGIGAADVPFQWIGIRCAGGSTTPRRVYVYEWFSNTPISQADIDFTGKAVGDWVWVKVAPATMLANGYYALALKVTAGDGQTWSNPGPTTFEPVFANIYAIYRDTITAPGFANGEINTQFVGLDLGW